MSRRISVLLLSLALLLPGCAFGIQASQDEGPAVYGGVRLMVESLTTDEEHLSVGDRILIALDTPLSFVLDTLFLPISIINELVRGGIDVHASRRLRPTRRGRTSVGAGSTPARAGGRGHTPPTSRAEHQSGG